MRPLIHILRAAILAALPVGAWAECVGQNLIAALPAAQRAALQAEANAVPFPTGNLWTATRDGQTVTLVGTFHLNDPRHADTLTRLEPTLAQAATLLVEAGPQEEAALKDYVAKHPERLINSIDPPLPKSLTEADWLRLIEALQDRQIPGFFAVNTQPWYLTSILAIPMCQYNSGTNFQGLDRRLMDLAGTRGLPVAALEPYDTIFTIFDSFSRAEQLTMLTQALDTLHVEDDLAVTLADSYFAGENRLFWEFSRHLLITLSGTTEAEADRQMALVEEALINRRNRAWIPLIEAAATRGPVIAAFGALHLPGDEGVLNLMAQGGWTVVPVSP